MPDGAILLPDPAELRLRLLGNGYQPVPIFPHDAAVKSAGKRPMLDGWQRGGATPEAIRRWPAGNTGLLCGELVGIDIDILDRIAAEGVRELATDLLGPSRLIRIGRAPKTLLAYRTEEPGDKLLTEDFRLPDGTKAQVEILGVGQQFVAFGTHPETRQPYAWPEASPLDVPLSALPVVTREQLAQFRGAAADMIRAAGGQSARAAKRDTRLPATVIAAAPAPARAWPAPTMEEVEDALRAIPNTADWGGWVAMGSAIFDALADDGEDLFMAWSRKSSKHDEAEARRKWASFRTSPGTTTKAYLFREALDHGWKPKREEKPRREKPAARPRNDADPDDIELTEDGVALEFMKAHRDQLRYCHDTGRWYVWTGSHWQANRDHLAFHWARNLARKLNRNAEFKTKAITGKTAFAGGVEKFAQRDRNFAVTADIWDRDAFLLGTPAGTVDLKTGQLREARREDHITKAAAVAPAAAMDCPTWFAFLNQATAGDAHLIRFLSQWAGYCLTGSTREHALLFIYGPGGNGKSVFLNTVAGILADYCTTAPMDTFTSSPGDRHPTDLAMLRGARLVTATETEEGRAWAEAKIKQMTGGDPVTARFMRQDFFTFTPAFKLTIAGNHKPALKNVDDAARRRFNVVPFTHKPEKPDRDLEAKLRAEWPGILRWMITGCLDWQRNGLDRPAVVTEATAEYFEAQDTIGRWMAERCILAPHLEVKPGLLAADCRTWAAENGEAPPSAPQLRSALEKVRGVRYATVKGTQWVKGIGLQALEDARQGGGGWR